MGNVLALNGEFSSNEKSNFLKTFPNYDQMDGFFGAILVKAI